MQSDAATLETAIAALMAQRTTLDEALVDAALAKLREQLASCSLEAKEQQLRQVTVLFTDVVGSTALSQQLDPEEINTVLDGALASFTAVVQRHQGRVLQYAGDSLLAVFGTPVAHEDDAVWAVRAGLAIIEESRARSAMIEQRYGHAGFDVRVGINTGAVLLGGGVDSEHSIRGITVNIAAHMEQSAPAGALRISQDTYRQVRGRFELLEQAPLLVKGLDEPLVTYLVQSALPTAQRLLTRGVDGINTRMVGRLDELALLQQAYTELCSASPAGLRLWTVVGEAGLGKSRLLGEFERWVEQHAGQDPRNQPNGALWLRAFAGEALINRPYWMLRRLLTNQIDLLDSEDATLAREKWLSAVSPLLAGRSDAAVLGHLLGFDFSADSEVRALLGEARQMRDRGFFHAAQLLCALAERDRPLIVALDDLHWVDDGTLDFIDYLKATQPGLPLLLLGLTRPELFERRPSWRTPLAETTAQSINLSALSRAQADELVAELLKRLKPLPVGLCELVTTRADGNPFYMEELVNMLIDQKVIIPDAEGWRYQAERMHALTVPGSLVGVLQARLDALPAAERHTSQLAAVVGYQFWDECLRKLGALLPASLQGLLERELVLTQPDSSLGGMHEYAFKHHTLQQVAYAGVLKRTRREIHARVADWLLSLPGEPPLDLVAEHYERGGAAELALDYWQHAAEAAASRYANQQALMHTDRALALADLGDLPRRYALTLLRCRVMQLQSDRDRLALELDSLQRLAEGLAHAAKLSEALVRRARYCFDGGDIELALAYARQGVAQAPPSDPACEAPARALVAQCLLRIGDLAQANRESAEALRLAQRAGDHATEGMILNDMGMRADIDGDPGAAIDCYERALACHRKVGNRNNEGGTLSNLAYAALVLGDYAAAVSQFAEARDLFAKIGSSQNEGITLINMGIARLNQGQAAEAFSYAKQALQMLQATGFRWAAGAALRLSGQAALAMQDAETAATKLQASLDLFEAIGMPHLALEATAGLADVALARGDIPAALTLAQGILSQQDSGLSLDGSEEPMRVQLICYNCLSAAGHPRAQQLLDAAFGSLMERAERISDPLRRQSYLHEVPYHRGIAAAWQASQPSTGAD
ncbi:ATP-binding protein [Roseateles oligotrophus]|uniref:AAA family ATPase n=1 Tax=Roseateles oligotrophus TaxID=1769250 RepID=A0ABT2YKD1_9BURK|nr:adenylate/guanylate cyclase domain-containing protein [Roseateles oligotrophus]MCV2370504.1 AAA family ATPase [Roseateles oligotrophus]